MNVIPWELKQGTQEEFEHTDDPRIAQKIAMDHLREDPHYYSKLKLMEEGKFCEICNMEGHDMSEHYGEDEMGYYNDPDFGQEQSDVEYVNQPGAQYIDQPTDEEFYQQTTAEVPPLNEQAQPSNESFQSKPLGVAKDLMTLAQAASSGDADTILRGIEMFSKSQLTRFLDISVIGPLLLFWAWKGKLSKTERMVMGLIGAGTVIYNGRNYLKNKKIVQPAELQAIKQELVNSKLSGY